MFFAERAQRDIDVPVGDVDMGQTGRMGGVACHIAGALAMADDPEALRPALHLLGSLCPAVSDEDLNVRLSYRFLLVARGRGLGSANSQLQSTSL